METMIAAGEDVNHQSSAGVTALHRTADNNQAEVVRLLLASGAQPDIPASDGLTAVGWAQREQHLQVLAVFEEGGFHDAQPVEALVQELQAGNEVERLAAELIQIGRDLTLPSSRAASGYFAKDSPLPGGKHPRVVEIGVRLYELGDHQIDIMKKVNDFVERTLGVRLRLNFRAAGMEIGIDIGGAGTGSAWLH